MAISSIPLSIQTKSDIRGNIFTSFLSKTMYVWFHSLNLRMRFSRRRLFQVGKPLKPIEVVKIGKFDEEELEILEAVESGNIKYLENAADIQAEHQKYAKAMFRKDAEINIRLSSKDLHGLQKKALTEGIPYQVLVSSILHKYVEGRLSEKSS